MQVDEPEAGAFNSRRAPHASNPLRPVPNRARKSHTHLNLMLDAYMARVRSMKLDVSLSSKGRDFIPSPASGYRTAGLTFIGQSSHPVCGADCERRQA